MLVSILMVVIVLLLVGMQVRSYDLQKSLATIASCVSNGQNTSLLHPLLHIHPPKCHITYTIALEIKFPIEWNQERDTLDYLPNWVSGSLSVRANIIIKDKERSRDSIVAVHCVVAALTLVRFQVTAIHLQKHLIVDVFHTFFDFFLGHVS